MIQQVNLYQDVLKQGRKKTAINPYWASISAIILLFVSLSAYLIWQTQKTESQVQQLRQSLKIEQTRIDQILSKMPNQEVDPKLSAEVTQWQTMLEELNQNYQLLSGQSTSQSPGFSNYFQALSDQSIPEVWLSALYLDSQKQIINIEGSSFMPEKIPVFLQRLQKEPIFRGRSFAKLIMQQSEDIPNQLDFKLSTTLETPEKKDHAQ